MDKTALSDKITEISETVFRYCIARTESTEDAEDLSQEILTALVRSVPSLRDEKAFYGFLWSLAGNVTRHWRRKQQRAQTLPLPEKFGEEAADEDGDDGWSMAAYLPRLRRELALLCKNYRQATVLYYLRGFSCGKIAETLGISESMVKYLLFRARKKLKEGIDMERTFGKHSYDPVTLVPYYSGEGPNRFWEFMQSRIRQNILSACYQKALTEEQISLEIGVPLPYIEEEIAALADKNLLLRQGRRYLAGLIILDSACREEIDRAAEGYRKKIAAAIGEFLETHLQAYKSIGFRGSEFSDGTLRWQLAVLVFRAILGFGIPEENRVASPEACAECPKPVTGWGERAHLWLEEKQEATVYFSYCGVSDRQGDSLFFFDYLQGGKGDHRDFFGKEREIGLFCGICRGEPLPESVYDQEAACGMVEKGYVVREGERFRPAVPVYTAAQYRQATKLTADFVHETLSPILSQMLGAAREILSAHTPAHLQSGIEAIAVMDLTRSAVGIPGRILVEKGVLSRDYHPLEMPTTYAVLAK